MKKNFYLQHPLMAMHDPRMRKLVEEEKLRGLGAYWFIIEKLGVLPEPRAPFEYLHPFCDSRKIPFAYLMKIIKEYGLFTLEENDCFALAELNPVKKRREKAAKNVQEKPGSNTKNVENQPETLKLKNENQEKKSDNSLRAIDLQKNGLEPIKENIKDIITTAAEEEEEKEKAAAVAAAGTSARFGTDARPCRTLQPVRPWKEMVGELSQDSSWLELACMKSCYGALLKRCLPRALEIFRQHIETYDKGDDLLNMSDVRRYFINFVAAGNRTSQELRNSLLAHEAEKRRATPPVDNPYRHEQLIDGQRTYLGCPIPDDAPPRPDANAIWNEEIHRWMPDRKGKTESC